MTLIDWFADSLNRLFRLPLYDADLPDESAEAMQPDIDCGIGDPADAWDLKRGWNFAGQSAPLTDADVRRIVRDEMEHAFNHIAELIYERK